jgi:hypothetical protein
MLPEGKMLDDVLLELDPSWLSEQPDLSDQERAFADRALKFVGHERSKRRVLRSRCGIRRIVVRRSPRARRSRRTARRARAAPASSDGPGSSSEPPGWLIGGEA